MGPWSSKFVSCNEGEIEEGIKLVWACKAMLCHSFVSCPLQFYFSIFIFLFIFKDKANHLIYNLLGFFSSTIYFFSKGNCFANWKEFVNKNVL